MSKFWNNRRFRALSYRWKREKLAGLEAEAKILEVLLRTTREQIAELRSLEGEKLAGRFGCQFPEEVAGVMRDQVNFLRELQEIWITGERTLKARNQSNAA